MPDDSREIRVDSAWKEEVRKERERLKQEEDKQRREQATRKQAGGGPSETDRGFVAIVQSLATQAIMQLGQVENPLTGQREIDLQGAKQTIDIIEALQRKTKGNLSQQEQEMLEGALYDLRMIYVERRGGTPPAGKPGAEPGGQGRPSRPAGGQPPKRGR